MPILNVCDEQLAELARRKQMLSFRIATQRAELETGLQHLRKPLYLVDRAISIGARLREHGPVIAMVLTPLLYLLRRPLAGGAGLVSGLFRKATKWWTVWKVGSRMFSSIPGTFRRGRGRGR